MRTAAGLEILALLPLDRRSRAPLHRQIYDGMRRAILDGLLREGQRLPSTRALAGELGISRLPVLTAFEQLVHEGYLEGRPGSGTFVRAALSDGVSDASTARPARGASARRGVRGSRGTGATRRADAAPPPRDEGGIRPFRTSLPALDEFPVSRWARLVARHAHRLSPVHMAYGDPAGLGELRAAIAEHLRAARAVRCEPEQVLVVSGSQAALRLCAAVLLRAGDRAAIEEPGYGGARSALGIEGVELLPVPVDDDGLEVETLRRTRAPIRAVYVTPSHQYPSGVSMSAARRLALLDWAARHDAWILEDDFDSEYRYVSRPLGALQGMDARGRVIYIGTFSKVLFPALRIGYLVVPPALVDAFVAAREATDVFSPTLPQLVLLDFMREGHFTRHLRRMRGIYRRRRDALLEGLARHCAGLLEVHNADAGLHVATMLPAGVDDVDVVRRLGARGLTALPLSACYAGRERRSGLLLGFGGIDEVALAGATRELGAVLRAAARPRASA